MKDDDISKILQNMKARQDKELLKAAEDGFERRKNPQPTEKPVEPEETLTYLLGRVHDREAQKTLAEVEKVFKQKNEKDKDD